MNVESLYSPVWYRVAALRPRLRAHVDVHRHHYRGNTWFVLEDRASSRNHRLTNDTWFLVGLMNGTQSVEELWERAVERLGDDAPTQDETIRVLAQLHAADMLLCDVSPSAAELFRRYRENRKSNWRQRAGNPLAVRLPLLDPDRLLKPLLPLAHWLFSPVGALLWVLWVSVGALLAFQHMPELRLMFEEQALQPHNLLLLGLVYPVVKIAHEAGHALAVKRWGGAVHETGIILLALMPMPYVDASAASAFRSKHRRMAVGAAGIAVEMAVAAAAMFLWLLVEPGTVRTLAFDLVLIGGFSTLVFNGNPLLRFDAYYVLSDAIEIPNLATRSSRYLHYLALRYLFGVADASSPAHERSECAWLATYGVTSFAYRIFIVLAIAWFLSGRYPLLGGALALWALFAYIALPVGRGLRFLLRSPRIARQRVRATAVSSALAISVLAAAFLIQVPLSTRAEGYLRIADDAMIRAGTDCFVVEVLVQPGAALTAGTPIVQCDDPLLTAQSAVLEASLRELEARHRALPPQERAAAGLLSEQRKGLLAGLDRNAERAAALIVRSPVSGTLVMMATRDLTGSFIAQGQTFAFVLDPGRVDVHVVVPQARMGLVRERLSDIQLRFAENTAVRMPARLVREYPALQHQLPSLALGSSAGGGIAVDPRDEQGALALDGFYELELALPAGITPPRVGGRVHARFDHGKEALAWRWQRQLRQLFLGRMHG